MHPEQIKVQKEKHSTLVYSVGLNQKEKHSTLVYSTGLNQDCAWAANFKTWELFSPIKKSGQGYTISVWKETSEIGARSHDFFIAENKSHLSCTRSSDYLHM